MDNPILTNEDTADVTHDTQSNSVNSSDQEHIEETTKYCSDAKGDTEANMPTEPEFYAVKLQSKYGLIKGA